MTRSIRPLPVVAVLVACTLAATVTPPARAGFVANLQSVTPKAGNYVWMYNVDVDVNTTIKKGDFFTIYDFNGFIPGSNTQPANWAFASANLGQTAAKTLPQDDPTIPNLTWTYEGSTPITGPLLSLPFFTAMSKYQGQALHDFGSQTHRTDNGRPVVNVSPIEVAVPSPQVPEPEALLLMGLGLPLVGAARLLRFRKNRAAR